MQFKVPQFLEIEDKIFGPFTFKEFVYLTGGAGLCFVLYKLLGLGWGILPMAVIAGLALALTFYKPNNKPFIHMVEAACKYCLQSKLYIWQRRKISYEESYQKARQERIETAPVLHAPKLSGSKLRDLAWSLDVLDLKRGENPHS